MGKSLLYRHFHLEFDFRCLDAIRLFSLHHYQIESLNAKRGDDIIIYYYWARTPKRNLILWLTFGTFTLYIEHLLKNEWNLAILLVCLQFACPFSHQIIKDTNKIAERGKIMHYLYVHSKFQLRISRHYKTE